LSAAWFPTEGGPIAPETLLVLGGIGLLLLVALLFALMLLSRRQQGREIRDLVVTLEELRSGQTRRRAAVDSRSSLAVVADAMNRLAEDLSGRWAGAERAREQYHAFLEAARDYGVVSVDMDWDIRGFSEGAGELLGWTEEEVLGRPASLLFEEAAWKELLP
jgi:PAS domain-containing protein